MASQTEEALGWTAEGEKFADANPVEVEQDQESTALSIADVPVFDRPMDASENDKWTGVQDELGNRQYKTIFGRTYFVRPADDQRTNYEKIQQDIIPAVQSYLDNPTAPSKEQTVDFLKQSLGAAWETFKIPGDLAAGNKGMEDVTLGNIFELAGGTGVASTVGKVPDGDSSNTMRIFGGVGMEGAGTNKAFKKAKKLLKKLRSKDYSPFPPETGEIDFNINKKIWEQTNWYVDPNDGQWRFYIDDSKSELKPFKETFKVDPEAGLTFKELSEKNIPRENSKSVLLKNFFDHTDLYEKYPELEGLNVGFYSDPKSNILGSADSKNNTIYLNLSSYENYEDMKSVVLHEIQHIVQEKEGFVPGSNQRSIPPELVKKQETEIATKIKPDVDTKVQLEREEKAIQGRIAEELEDAKTPIPGLTAEQEQEIFKIKPNNGGPSWASLGREYGVPVKVVQKAWGRVNILNYLREKERELNLALTKIESNLFSAGLEIDGIEFEFYQGAGGEIESRLVQAMASGEKGLANDGFPVSARNSMLGKEGNKYQYRGKEGVDPLVYTNQPRRDPDQKSFLDKLKSKVGVSNNSELESSQVRRYRDDLDPEVYDAFDELAEIQRGAPEIAMTSAQKALEGGVLSYALEHTGDLTHRMAEKGGVYGAEYVKPKVNRLLDSLLSEYGFEKEHLENLKNTAQFNYDKLGKNTNLSFEQYYQNYVDNAQEKIKIYAEEHKKVPVYNDMQLAGREAAIAIGEGRYTDAVEHLYLIRSAINDGTYRQKSVEFNPKIDFRKESDQGFAQGGVVNNMNNQMEMLFDEGGIADDGMRRDPVSGNEIPPGSLAEEVRDDIPAQLSEGEYVVPADVVRFFGVKYFEDLRMEAKMGLSNMEANGRIGGEPIGPSGMEVGPSGMEENPLTPEEMAVLEQMGMAVGGFVPEQEPPQAVGNSVQGFAPGGDVQPTTNYEDTAAGLPSWAAIPGASYMPQEWQKANLPSTTSYKPAQTITTADSTPVTTTTTDTATDTVTATTGKEACEKMGMMFDETTQQCVLKQGSSTSDDPTVTPTTGESQGFEWKEPDVDYFSMSDEDLAKVSLETSNKFEDKIVKAGALKLFGGAGLAGFGLFDSVRQGSTIAEVRSAALVAAAKGNTALADTLNARAKELVGKSSLLVQGADYFGALSGVNDFAQQVKFKMPKGMEFDQTKLGLTESQQVRVLDAASPPGMVYQPETKTYVEDTKDNSPPGGGGTFVETSSGGTPIYTPTSTTVRPVERDNSPPKAPKTTTRTVTNTPSVSSGIGSLEAAENSSQITASTYGSGSNNDYGVGTYNSTTGSGGFNKGGLMKKRKKK